jgi:HJR/Mrr/RecB family endonuclease
MAAAHHLARSATPSGLLVVDDVELASLADQEWILRAIGQGSAVVLATARAALPALELNVYQLDEFDDRESVEWLSRFGAREYQVLLTLNLPRNPRLLRLLVDQAKRHGLEEVIALAEDQGEFRRALEEIGEDGRLLAQRSALLGPDGASIQDARSKSSPLIVEVQEVTDELIRRLHDDPSKLYEISPRRFEELVAELLRRQGFETTLTATTRDGGYDVWAAKKDLRGSFLYLVECKRYNLNNPVGVSVVRSLYGVVESKRATAGIVATTSRFTSDATAFQQTVQFRLSLHDYVAIQGWLRLASGS